MNVRLSKNPQFNFAKLISNMLNGGQGNKGNVVYKLYFTLISSQYLSDS